MRPRCVRPASALLLLAFFALAPACAHGGSAGAEARQATIETNLPALQACWTDIAADYPDRAGSLLFAVDIRRNGSVEWVDIEIDEMQVPRLSACAVKQIKRWRFPEGSRQSIRFGIEFTA